MYLEIVQHLSDDAEKRLSEMDSVLFRRLCYVTASNQRTAALGFVACRRTHEERSRKQIEF